MSFLLSLSRYHHKEIQFLTTREAAWYSLYFLPSLVYSRILVVSVCLSDDNFRKFISAHPVSYIFRECWSSSCRKAIGSRSRLQEQKWSKLKIPQCKTLIGNNSGSIEHRAMKSGGGPPPWILWKMDFIPCASSAFKMWAKSNDLLRSFCHLKV